MDLHADLSQRLATLPGLPSLPVVAIRVIELSRDPDASLPKIAAVVNTDPALAARVLRAANSAQFTRGRECQNLRQALVTLGMDTTLTIALGFSVVNALRSASSDSMDYSGFWKRSLLAAIAARSLAEFMQGVDRDNLFLAGLLQDIGMLAVNQLAPGLYARARSEGVEHDALCDLERDDIGASHVDVGVWLLRQWNMPEYLPAAIATSHDRDPARHAGVWGRESACLALSGLVADVWTAQDRSTRLECLPQYAAALVGLDFTDVGMLLAKVRKVVPETELLFSMSLVDERCMQKVLDDASEMILRNNLSALKQAGALLDEAVQATGGPEHMETDNAQRLLELASEALRQKPGKEAIEPS